MAIDDITRQPLALLKLSQVVLLIISIGCVFGVANGWWYYVGATLVAAFLNTIIMLVCYYWKQTFETTFLELSYTSYFVLAIFISAILLFAQPHYEEAPWKQNDASALQANYQSQMPTTPLPPPPTKTTIKPEKALNGIKTNLRTEPPKNPLGTDKTTPTEKTTTTVTTTTAPPTITAPPTTTAPPPTTSTKPTAETITTSEVPTTTTTATEPTTIPKSTPSSTTISSTTSTLSTTSSKPPEPKEFSKEGPWIAGGVFCIFLSLTYSIELYFLTRRLVGFGGRPSSSSPPMPSQPGM